MKILFIVPYPTEGASNRIRVEQFLPLIRERGISYKLRPFVGRRFYKILYLQGNYIKKILLFILATVLRVTDVFRAISYDLIFIHREAYPIGPAVFEKIFHYMGKPIIYDFDDAIFLSNTSETNTYIERLKNPDKISSIISMSSAVIAGNRYLYDFAVKYNKNVFIIPSSIDTDKYTPVADRGEGANKDIVIGWVGSITTRKFVYGIEDALSELEKKYDNIIFKIIGGGFYSKKVKKVFNIEWSLETEKEYLKTFDIGIMPMSDDAWTRGKCGFKAILYMASGIPTVCSPVGANAEIVQDGVNGFWATTKEEWVDKLSRLIEDKDLRLKMGARARVTAETKYSVKANAPVFLNVITSAGRKDG